MLKMKDVFERGLMKSPIWFSDTQKKYITNALHEQDRLKEENERLRELVRQFRDFAVRDGWKHVLIDQANSELKGDSNE